MSQIVIGGLPGTGEDGVGKVVIFVDQPVQNLELFLGGIAKNPAQALLGIVAIQNILPLFFCKKSLIAAQTTDFDFTIVFKRCFHPLHIRVDEGKVEKHDR